MQVVPTGYETAVDDASKIKCQWDDKMNKALLDENNPNSLVFALLKCLGACPLDARKDVIGNILVCGDTSVVVPDLARRLALKFKAVLGADGDSTGDAEPSSGAKDDIHLTMVPPAMKQLKALAGHVGLISSAPYRADCISWVGGSIHAALWHRHDEQSPVEWVLSPTGAAE
jgi:actin-related protein